MLVGFVPSVFEALVYQIPVPLVEVLENGPLVEFLVSVILVENVLLLGLLLFSTSSLLLPPFHVPSAAVMMLMRLGLPFLFFFCPFC